MRSSKILYIGLAIMLLSFVNYKSNLDQNVDNSILWNAKTKLTWKDFRGRPDSLSKYKAITTSGIEFKSKTYNDSIVLWVPCFFRKNESWTKDKESMKLLKHEQLHFDIAELVARKIRKDCSSHISKTPEESSTLLQAIYDKHYYKTWDSLSVRYDKETNHSLIEKKQQEWEVKIAKELKALEKYANLRVVIKRVKK